MRYISRCKIAHLRKETQTATVAAHTTTAARIPQMMAISAPLISPDSEGGLIRPVGSSLEGGARELGVAPGALCVAACCCTRW